MTTTSTMVSREFHSVFYDNIISRPIVLFVCIIYDFFGDIVFIVQRWRHLQKVSIRLVILRKDLTMRNPHITWSAVTAIGCDDEYEVGALKAGPQGLRALCRAPTPLWGHFAILSPLERTRFHLYNSNEKSFKSLIVGTFRVLLKARSP